MKYSALFLLVSVCACAPLTEDQIYDREVRKIEANERFQQDKEDCERRHGIMVYDHRTKPRNNDKPDSSGMVTARCDMTMDDALRRYY